MKLFRRPTRIESLFLLVLLVSPAACGQDPESSDWPAYQGGSHRNQYSSLTQITPSNVHRLEVAWIYRTGDADPNGRSQIQCNPLVIDGVLYGTSPKLKVFALDAAAGRELWKFDPFAGIENPRGVGVNRGLSIWESEEERRILFTAGTWLYALDADTGMPLPDFGEGGRVDLNKGFDRDIGELYVSATSPGAIYQDLLILGSRVSEGPGPSAPGDIRAYDVRSGEIRWVFHTIPRPGELGHETWPEEAWTRAGGANSWSGMTVDRDRGIVYVPTGSPAFDFWGGDRKGANLFGTSLVALNALTGQRIWHFQFVHHDLWDRDLPAPPNLVTLEREGERIPAVAQVTKSGHVFVFHRETGEPLFPIEENPYPPSDLQGEETWPTQPLPVRPPPFARQALTEENVTRISPESREHALEVLSRVRTGGQFIPPSLEGTVIFPGFDGGAEWGGASYDPGSGILYVNSNEMPWILTMVDVGERDAERRSLGEQVYAVNCAVCHGVDRRGDLQGSFPPVVDLEERYTPESLMELIAKGQGFMPAFEFLSTEEKRALLTFLMDVPAQEKEVGEREAAMPTIPYSHTGYNRFLDPEGYPAVEPPWGTLNAINLNSGEIEWQVPLGEFEELTARGIPKTGTENYGGPVATEGGLIFIGASKDEHFRVFDKRTGEELWKTALPAGGYATPALYSIDGRQYVVIACGGGKMGTKSGDAYVAFALPEQDG